MLFDDLICNVNDGNLHNDYEFRLYERDCNDNIIEVCYKGVWFIVDNGYLNWSCTVPPIKDATSYERIRFSERLESMRKDVKCAFGILKGRWAILRYGLRFGSIKQCDKLWLTCCALHNKLLFVDGLDKCWEEGVASHWEKINEKYKKNATQTSFAVSRLGRKFYNGEINTENEFKHTSASPSSDCFKKYTANGKRIVSKMPLSLFQNCLFNHFDIRFKQNDICWPQSNRKPCEI